MNPARDLPLDLSSGGLGFPSSCSVVIIAGEYLQNIDNVIRSLQRMILVMKATPMAVFVVMEDDKSHRNISFTSSKLPLMVDKFFFLFIVNFFLKQYIFQVFIPSSTVSKKGIIFDMKCPGEYDRESQSLYIFSNGTVNKAKRFQDVCKMYLTIAYNEDSMYFMYNKETNLALEFSTPR